MTATPLVATLKHALREHSGGRLCVAFSGGPDSTALLHVLAALPEARARGLRALHVDHGLHADSVRWATHCRDFCTALDVPLTVVRVDVPRDSGQGLEAAARDARYAAFAASLADGEQLLLAHHRDDQAETVLLKLLRGAGPEGLGGMRQRRVLGPGWLWRPLLDLPRQALLDHLDAHGLACIDDPSNRAPQLARSFLRSDILPRLHRHWPQASRALAHSAMLNRSAADHIDTQCRARLPDLLDADGSLHAREWLALHAAVRAPLLDLWLRQRGLPAPSLAPRHELERQAREAASDRVPCVAWPGAEVHLWRGRLHALAPLPPVPAGWEATWQGETLALPAGAGMLRWSTPVSRPPPLQVRLGETGLRLRPAGHRHTRALRDLFQQGAVPPWQRRRCPALRAVDGTLLAIADLWSTDAGQQLFARLGAHPVWNRH